MENITSTFSHPKSSLSGITKVRNLVFIVIVLISLAYSSTFVLVAPPVTRAIVFSRLVPLGFLVAVAIISWRGAWGRQFIASITLGISYSMLISLGAVCRIVFYGIEGDIKTIDTLLYQFQPTQITGLPVTRLTVIIAGVYSMIAGLLYSAVTPYLPYFGGLSYVGILSFLLTFWLVSWKYGLIYGSVIYLAFLVGLLRIPFYFIEGAGLLHIPRLGGHPIWWDELAVLPFLQTHIAIDEAWNSDANQALRRFARLAGNPYQRWAFQRALYRRLHQPANGIRFLYSLCRLQDLGAYPRHPLTSLDWQSTGSVRLIFLAEVACVGSLLPWMPGDSIDKSNEKIIWWLTKPLRINQRTTLTLLAFTLYLLSLDDFGELELKGVELLGCGAKLDTLKDYSGGVEIQDSFRCFFRCLKVSSLAEIAQVSSSLGKLPPVEGSIRPPVIEALLQCSRVAGDISVSLKAASRTNQLGALGRATEGLQVLQTLLEEDFWPPEKSILKEILQRWRKLASDQSGRLGRLVIAKPVTYPYVAGPPVVGTLFVGRDDILREIEELWLKRGQVDSMVLYGHRRMGKSSILRNLSARLDPSYNLIVDFNMQRVGQVRSTGELLYALVLSMHDHLIRGGGHVPSPPVESAFQDNFSRAFNSWLVLLGPLMANHRFIIVIDEYELLESAIDEGRIDRSLIAYLRGVIQGTDWFVLLLAGLYTLQEKCHDYWHPLFASIKTRRVSFLSTEATRRLLVQPSDDFPLSYTQESLDEIAILTNGQPFLVQLIGQNLVKKFNSNVFENDRDANDPLSLAELQDVIESDTFFEDGSGYFKGIWMQAADEPYGQHLILQALSQCPKSFDDLAREIPLSRPELAEALKTLINHDVVRLNDNTCYTFTVELMRRWVVDRNTSN